MTEKPTYNDCICAFRRLITVYYHNTQAINMRLKASRTCKFTDRVRTGIEPRHNCSRKKHRPTRLQRRRARQQK